MVAPPPAQMTASFLEEEDIMKVLTGAPEAGLCFSPSGRSAQISPLVDQRRWPIPTRAEETELASSLGEETERRAEPASQGRRWGCKTSLADSLRYVGPATGLSLPLSRPPQGREAFKLRGQLRGQTAPQKGPSLGVTDTQTKGHCTQGPESRTISFLSL